MAWSGMVGNGGVRPGSAGAAQINERPLRVGSTPPVAGAPPLAGGRASMPSCRCAESTLPDSDSLCPRLPGSGAGALGSRPRPFRCAGPFFLRKVRGRRAGGSGTAPIHESAAKALACAATAPGWPVPVAQLSHVRRSRPGVCCPSGSSRARGAWRSRSRRALPRSPQGPPQSRRART